MNEATSEWLALGSLLDGLPMMQSAMVSVHWTVVLIRSLALQH